MIAVIQRVSKASVSVQGCKIAEIGPGLMILLGVKAGDTERHAEALSAKIAKLRIFEDEVGKMNRSVCDVQGGALVVSNFTLLAAYSHGNRPDYLAAEKPQRANVLYELFAQKLQEKIQGGVARGRFGADMQVALVNDGPVTLVLDSENLVK